eukprot:TRINITY_DN5566_c0_g1_i2.p1 TRINITY_DN5566_c0_g1~~TRINITY_DN5566_c0_g1_i2.p1  ORF type:complete len:198 (-),score=59.14 TRINITY_DN5566_c0_g1_i2:800-1393(-)
MDPEWVLECVRALVEDQTITAAAAKAVRGAPQEEAALEDASARLAALLRRVVTAAEGAMEPTEPPAGAEESLLDRGSARQREAALWFALARLNRTAQGYFPRLLGLEDAVVDAVDADVATPAEATELDDSEVEKRFRGLHLERLTRGFAADLDAFQRADESSDEIKMAALIDAFEVGATLVDLHDKRLQVTAAQPAR